MTDRQRVTRDYWESAHSKPRFRVPSGLWDVGMKNVLRLLRSHVEPGASVLEIGCAPGRHLAYLAVERRARVCGVDYSKPGIAYCRELFAHLNLEGEFHCEDVFSTTLPEGTFDMVYSLGVVEHFDDPRSLIEKHVRLAKPGGLALIVIPNYGGIYGRLQGYFEPQNLEIHNVDIMSPEKLRSLAPADLAPESSAYPAGRLSPWIVGFYRRWPAPVAKGVSYALNALGLVQPFDVSPLCPLLVLKMRRAPS
jgi:2-polyprenyl-3-methyl-5-hydroxy-6-metoxy-1,4-benzoquinol methylase